MALDVLGMQRVQVSALGDSTVHLLSVSDAMGERAPAGSEFPLENSFCQHTSTVADTVVIPDTALDPRIAHIVARCPFPVNAYLGVPIVLSDGGLHGTMCAFAPEPRAFTAAQIACVEVLAAQIAARLEYSLLHHDAQNTADVLGTTLAALDRQRTTLRTVTHDLRTPLTAIVLASDLLQHPLLGTVTTEQQEVIDQIKRSSSYMNGLIQDLWLTVDGEEQHLALQRVDRALASAANGRERRCGKRGGRGQHVPGSVAVAAFTGSRSRVARPRAFGASRGIMG